MGTAPQNFELRLVRCKEDRTGYRGRGTCISPFLRWLDRWFLSQSRGNGVVVIQRKRLAPRPIASKLYHGWRGSAPQAARKRELGND